MLLYGAICNITCEEYVNFDADLPMSKMSPLYELIASGEVDDAWITLSKFI